MELMATLCRILRLPVLFVKAWHASLIRTAIGKLLFGELPYGRYDTVDTGIHS